MVEQCIGNAQTTDRNRSGAPFHKELQSPPWSSDMTPPS